MITNTPAVAQLSNDQRRPPQKWWDENPFGDMFPGFPGPELHRFFRELPSLPEMPRHGMQGMGSGVIVDPSGVMIQPVKKLDDLRKATDNPSSEKGILLLVCTAEGARFVVLKATG